ncbi:aspartate--tRNA(Asn) ligase [Candidatus Saccharibacteria bacterium]|nr:aspartate--tRNA(Asn) ligase [Candidatus Saccharibacteria bacterium]
MSRLLASDVTSHVGKSVRVSGWLHKKRLLGGLTFIVVRDRSGLVQAVVQNKAEVEKLRGLQNGTVLSVEGTAKAEPRAPGGAEIHDPKLDIISPVTDEPPIEVDKPLSHKSENLDTLFDNRPLGLRSLQERAIFKVQAKVLEAFRDYFKAHDFTEMNSPKLLAEATEGGAEVFKLDYFGKTATLAQSAQFYKQIMVGVFERVFETNPTFRAEPSATTRHMTEYITIDAEMGFVDFEELLNFAGGALLAIIERVQTDCADELKLWNVPPFVLPKKAGDIPRITIHEIHAKFLQATKEDHTDEDDLAPAEERWICDWAKKEHGSEAVFVTGWSVKSKTFKFYHRANDKRPDMADRADLLFRGVEITTLSMREHRYDRLIKQLKAMGGDPANPGFAPLLSVYKYGMPPHGGFGWGLERSVETIMNLRSVKEATLFPRDINRLTP